MFKRTHYTPTGNFNLICTDKDMKFPVNTTPVELDKPNKNVRS